MVRTKNEDRFEGSFEITENVHDRRYQLQGRDGKVIQRNVEHLKHWIDGQQNDETRL